MSSNQAPRDEPSTQGLPLQPEPTRSPRHVTFAPLPPTQQEKKTGADCHCILHSAPKQAKPRPEPRPEHRLKPRPEPRPEPLSTMAMMDYRLVDMLFLALNAAPLVAHTGGALSNTWSGVMLLVSFVLVACMAKTGPRMKGRASIMPDSNIMAVGGIWSLIVSTALEFPAAGASLTATICWTICATFFAEYNATGHRMIRTRKYIAFTAIFGLNLVYGMYAVPGVLPTEFVFWTWSFVAAMHLGRYFGIRHPLPEIEQVA